MGRRIGLFLFVGSVGRRAGRPAMWDLAADETGTNSIDRTFEIELAWRGPLAHAQQHILSLDAI
jgi:hypothetical protein